MINFPRLLRLALLFILPLPGLSCDKKASVSNQSAPATAPSIQMPSVASLSPAATDLIVGMGAVQHLTAISNYDPHRPETAGLPSAGDYLTTDWETLAAVHPSILIVQMDESRIPQGLRERAATLGASLVNIHIETVSDIFQTIDQLGAALGETKKAAAAAAHLQKQLDVVRRDVTGMPRTRTLISLNESASSAAGAGTYLDDLLNIAGGTNVLDSSAPHWPSIDRERLIDLAPKGVVVLLPAGTPQVVKAANDFWSSVPGRNDRRITVVTDPWALTPGIEVGNLAERLAAALHPSASIRSATPGAAQ